MKKFLAIVAALSLLLTACSTQTGAAESPEQPLSVTLDVLDRTRTTDVM